MYYRGIIRSIKHYRINPIIKILILSDFVIWSSYQLLAPIFAIFVTEQIPGGSIAVVGIASALNLISKSLFEMPVGIYIDRSKSEKDDLYTALFGTVLIAMAYYLYSLIGTVWQLYALQILIGIGSALAYPGWYSIFTHHVDKGKEAFEWSVYDVLLGIGMAAAAALGGFLADGYGFGVLFKVVGALTFLGALLLVIIRKSIFLPKKKEN